MKAIIVHGCMDCPYCKQLPEYTADNYWCFQTGFAEISFGKNPPKTPHPKCPLNDVPTEEQIREFADNQNYILGRTESIEKGATWAINQITK